MISSLNAVKRVCILLTIIFVVCAFLIITGFFGDDYNYFEAAECGAGLFVVAVVLGILALFIVLTVTVSKIIKEQEMENFAVAEEIQELKKQIKELQK